MSGMIVCKFGGSSVANAEQIEKVRRIVISDEKRRFVVVSAPGKDAMDSEKVTDHLFNIATDGNHFRIQGKDVSAKESYDRVVGKFRSLIDHLAIEGDDIIDDLESDLTSNISDNKRNDFFASRGEHYNAKVIARYFRTKGMNVQLMLPEDIGFLVSDRFGNAKVLPGTHANLHLSLRDDAINIIPGYYGITLKGDIAVMSRGGSDLTGGEVAYAVEAQCYENWTDTDGVYQVDPRIIPDAAVIPELTYKEIRLLSSRGFNVFHFDAMISCKNRKIPINIRNTNNPSADGTKIVTKRESTETAVGIGRMDNLAYVYIEKDMIGETIGFTKELLDIFKNYSINTHHYPSDMDDISVIVDQKDLSGKADDLTNTIKKNLTPNFIDINYNLCLLSPVGIGMKDTPGVLASAATALFKENINIEIVDQGPSQLSFHFGILQKYADTGLKALYKSLLKR
ncbi:MAG TPA: aspartate kinase [Deltaproteobacteria bacterium]|nr:aspartate kinase [Deltaproteobacteria bacterium]HPJ94261.1 aspartate kinase [Deltaproteobacteria bacterium]HPR51478.1 aspartate kinase [Deltaproteobacteria bacterium]